MSVDLNFIAADILGITLYKKSDKSWGADRKNFKFGPWNFSIWLEVTSDTIEEKEYGYFLSFSKRIWGYLIISNKSEKLVIFDGVEAGISKFNREKFGCGKVEKTLEKLGSSVKAVFQYKDNFWVEVKKDSVRVMTV